MNDQVEQNDEYLAYIRSLEDENAQFRGHLGIKGTRPRFRPRWEETLLVEEECQTGAELLIDPEKEAELAALREGL